MQRRSAAGITHQRDDLETREQPPQDSTVSGPKYLLQSVFRAKGAFYALVYITILDAILMGGEGVTMATVDY